MELQCGQARIQSAATHQFRMAPLGDDLALVHDHDALDALDCAEPVCDHDCCASTSATLTPDSRRNPRAIHQSFESHTQARLSSAALVRERRKYRSGANASRLLFEPSCKG